MNWDNSSASSQCKCVHRGGHGCLCVASECLYARTETGPLGSDSSFSLCLWCSADSTLSCSEVEILCVELAHSLGVWPPGEETTYLLRYPFPLMFQAIAAGVDSKSPLTGGRTSLNGPLNQAQNYPLERCHLHLERFEWNTFSTCCRESLYLPHPSYLITSSFHKWGCWSTERLSHFPRIAQAALADLGFILRDPGPRVHVQNRFPLCSFTTWRWYS